MPRTNAERQKAWRQRRAEHAVALEAEVAQLRGKLHDVRAELDAALGEAQRLALTTCRHPAAAVDGGTCRACGAEIW
jgi:hypothetical protein